MHSSERVETEGHVKNGGHVEHVWPGTHVASSSSKVPPIKIDQLDKNGHAPEEDGYGGLEIHG